MSETGQKTPFYIGLPQWHHPRWGQLGVSDLAEYSRLFNSVEGNTTFYALPKIEVVQRWRDMTSPEFRFCFKFPAAISHQAALHHYRQHLQAFWHILSPLQERIGQIWLQLPATFTPHDLPRLWSFFADLPQTFSYGVEMRHPQFFAKGDAERALNQGLHQRNINRVIMDSRPVHHAIADSAAIRDAQQKKPRVAVHAVATGHSPFIRFIGGDNLLDNQRWFTPWLQKIQQWHQEKKTIYLFIHTPDNADAPRQGLIIWQQLKQLIPDLPQPGLLPEQSTLF